MSTATVPPTTTPTEPGVAEAMKDAESALFRWNLWLHVGSGAQECPKRTDGTCADHRHFHAWVRLPNPWQDRDIVDKATAARARYKKMLRDPDSDQALALGELRESLKEAEKGALVEELVEKHWPEDYAAAVRAVDELEDPGYEPTGDDGEQIPRRFTHIDQDREEWQRQTVLPEEQRTPDFSQMEKNLSEYGEAVEEELERLRGPRREAFSQMSTDELVDKIIPGRVEELATEQYLHWHAAWTWLACTYKGCKTGTPSDRVWKDINTMKQQAPPEVVHALRAAFDALDRSLAASRRGKGS